jgi:anti-sigma regulatory factor (Ser/Thr protein kinase)
MSYVVTARPKTRIFPGARDQVRHVRDFVGRAIEGCPLADDVILLASELAANAVLHSASNDGGVFRVIVRQVAGLVRVDVQDSGSDNAPGVQCADGESGRGLGMVAAIATRWGHHGGPDGRVVWFEVEWQ